MAPVKLILLNFPLNSLTHFPFLSFPFPASQVIVFPGILSSAVFSQFLLSLGDFKHDFTFMTSTTAKRLSSVQPEPQSCRCTHLTLYCLSPLRCLITKSQYIQDSPVQIHKLNSQSRHMPGVSDSTFLIDVSSSPSLTLPFFFKISKKFLKKSVHPHKSHLPHSNLFLLCVPS